MENEQFYPLAALLGGLFGTSGAVLEASGPVLGPSEVAWSAHSASRGSRGLGDVYKRQLWGRLGALGSRKGDKTKNTVKHNGKLTILASVSYTHLTLPTIRSV